VLSELNSSVGNFLFAALLIEIIARLNRVRASSIVTKVDIVPPSDSAEKQ